MELTDMLFASRLNNLTYIVFFNVYISSFSSVMYLASPWHETAWRAGLEP